MLATSDLENSISNGHDGTTFIAPKQDGEQARTRNRQRVHSPLPSFSGTRFPHLCKMSLIRPVLLGVKEYLQASGRVAAALTAKTQRYTA